ncbi:hypothetical protein JTB14_019330 [Gonioctena quinquepunctata]|nr:hypothetical protein JTB14_019330 [Gonioctena quinquepunctata]
MPLENKCRTVTEHFPRGNAQETVEVSPFSLGELRTALSKLKPEKASISAEAFHKVGPEEPISLLSILNRLMKRQIFPDS